MNNRYLSLGLTLGAGLAVGVSALFPLTGCGLISSDVTNFDLMLSPKTFTIDTGGWKVDPNSF